jgi:nucleoside-diphosphate-sugar epimerase
MSNKYQNSSLITHHSSLITHHSLQLVTGGSGYLGSLLVRILRERGARVRVFDLVDASDRPEQVEFVQGDIRDYAAIRRACEKVEIVHHAVAQVPLARDRELFWSVNREGTENLLKAAREADVKKIVYISSSAVFGIPPRNPVDETVQPNPQEDYGRAKLAGERLCQQYTQKGLDVTIIRPRTILGHGRLGIFQLLFDWIADGRDVYVLGKGDNLYQFVHAEDLTDACIKAAERPGFVVYNIGAERFCSMRASLEGLIAHAQTGSRVRSIPFVPAVVTMKLLSFLRLAPFAPYHWLMYGRSLYFDLTRPKQELGWQPKWGNIDMLIQSYEWYLAHREQVKATVGASTHRSPVKQGALQILRWFS